MTVDSARLKEIRERWASFADPDARDVHDLLAALADRDRQLQEADEQAGRRQLKQDNARLVEANLGLRSEVTALRRQLQEARADRDEGWRSHNKALIQLQEAREALVQARADVLNVYAGWDSVRRKHAQAAIERIDRALAALSSAQPEETKWCLNGDGTTCDGHCDIPSCHFRMARSEETR